MTSVPVMSDGIRSGVNWMRLKASDRHLRQRADHQRLGQAGHAFEDAVAPAEQGDQQLLDDLVLADDDAAQLLLDVVEGVVAACGPPPGLPGRQVCRLPRLGKISWSGRFRVS